jgi:hypothetical protein
LAFVITLGVTYCHALGKDKVVGFGKN